MVADNACPMPAMEISSPDRVIPEFCYNWQGKRRQEKAREGNDGFIMDFVTGKARQGNDGSITDFVTGKARQGKIR
jgi:hypothetical protein